MSSKIAAAVVLYNPSKEVINNIISYISEINRLFVVDNSIADNQYLLTVIPGFEEKITYISSGENNGIGYALNTAATLAIEQGYQWMLTMDQDSCFDHTSSSTFFNRPHTTENVSLVGIFTPVHATQVYEEEAHHNGNQLVEVKTCMTSGNLLNLEIWKTIGGFNEEFFIDSVDHEYCLRLRLNKFLILLDTTCHLKHALGESGKTAIGGLQLNSTNHNAVRRYYMTRNRLYCIFRYIRFDPKMMLTDALAIVKETIKIILIESDKKKKILSTYRGFKDFFNRKMGKYPYTI